MSSIAASDQIPERAFYPRKDLETGHYGFWNTEGWAIDPQFESVKDFCHGFASIRLPDQTLAFCDLKGNIIPLMSLCDGRKPARVEYCSPGFGEDEGLVNFAPVKLAGWLRNRWGILDPSLNFRELPDPIFAGADNVRIFGEYAVPVFKSRAVGEASVGLFNLIEMRLELQVAYSWIYPSDGSIWVVARRSTQGRLRLSRLDFSFYDRNRRTFLPGSYWMARPFSSGIGAIGSESGPAYFIDENLQRLFDRDFGSVDGFRHGLAGFFEKDECGYVDTEGQVQLRFPQYENLHPFNRLGHSFANRNELEWDFDIIDRQGTALVSGITAIDFADGDFPSYHVSHDEEDWLYDKNLNKLFPINVSTS
jgi:hypothetical protein